MGIAGSHYEFKRSYKKKWAWPKMKFSGGGPKINFKDIEELPFDISDEHAAMLLWQNGGSPIHQWCCSKGYALQIRCFFGIRADNDLQSALLKYRNELPRFAIPIAIAENGLGDTSLLLTFPVDFRDPGRGREKKVWFYTWFHEEVPRDNELDDTILVAKSILALIKGLKETPPKSYKSYEGSDEDDDDLE
jgi:hypothetical protein